MDKTYNQDLSQMSKELILLLTIMKSNCSNDLLKSNFDHSNIDWNQFIELSKHHRVYPIISTNIKKFSLEWIPMHVADKLHQEYIKNTFRMLELSGEMEKTCQLFSEQGIRALLLKGPVLAKALYGDISLRTSSDIDLLIQIDDIEKVEQLLKNNGYVKDDYIETILNDWKWRHHHITFFHKKKKIKIEVHWRLNPGPAKEPNFEELWNRKQQSSLTRFPVFLLGNEDLFLFLVTHGARHGWSRLRWLLDIDQLMKQNLDWKRLIQLLRQYHYLHIGMKAILLAAQLFDTPIPVKIIPLISKKSQRLAKDTLFYLKEKVNLHSEQLPLHITNFHKRYLFSLMSVPHKILFLLSVLHPFPVDERTLPLPKPLHFLYFPLRPILFAWRKTRVIQKPRGSLK